MGDFNELKELMLTKFKELNTNMKTNHDLLMAEIKKVDSKAEAALNLAKANEEKAKHVEFEMDNLRNIIVRLEKKVSELDEQLDDQSNRSMRNTLVIKGIPQSDDNESWDKTSELLAKKLNECWGGNSSEEEIAQGIERAHRVGGEKVGIGKPIIAKFKSWTFSEKVKKIMRDHLITNGGNIYVSQLVTKKVQERQYQARKYRKELFNNDPNQNIFIKYPAQVMGKRKGSTEKYKLLKSF